mmetsp:Transcript_36473/g.58734  ORF Transcript_36473/g.58734 Transcript_36473/m.58734 type:complete len:201 (+) Transcript_36473:884-1486(+)
MKFTSTLALLATALVNADKPQFHRLGPVNRTRFNITSVQVLDSFSTRGRHKVSASADNGAFSFKVHGHEGAAKSKDVVAFFNKNIQLKNKTLCSVRSLPIVPKQLDFAVLVNYSAEWWEKISLSKPVYQHRKFVVNRVLISYSEGVWYMSVAKRNSQCYGAVHNEFSCDMREYSTFSACNLAFFGFPGANSTKFDVTIWV